MPIRNLTRKQRDLLAQYNLDEKEWGHICDTPDRRIFIVKSRITGDEKHFAY